MRAMPVILIFILAILSTLEPAHSTALIPTKLTQECAASREQCTPSVPCCSSEFECKLVQTNKETTCQIRECKPDHQLCHHPDECCSGYCQAVAVGTALCRTRL